MLLFWMLSFVMTEVHAKDSFRRESQYVDASQHILFSPSSEHCPSKQGSLLTPFHYDVTDLNRPPFVVSPVCQRNIDAAQAALNVYELFDAVRTRKEPLSRTVKRFFQGGDDSKASYEALRATKATPSLQNVAPPGYRLAEIYDDRDLGEAGNPRGTFAAWMLPDDPALPPIFAIKGTVTPQDWEKNLKGDVSDYLQRLVSAKTSDGHLLLETLMTYLKTGNDLVITGHSQGGALAQSLSYLLQRRLNQAKPKKPGQLYCVTQNALGGLPIVADYYKKDPLLAGAPVFENTLASRHTEQHSGNLNDPKIIAQIQYSNFFLPGDLLDSRMTDKKPGPIEGAIEKHSIRLLLQDLKKDYSALRDRQQLSRRQDPKKIQEFDAFLAAHPCSH